MWDLRFFWSKHHEVSFRESTIFEREDAEPERLAALYYSRISWNRLWLNKDRLRTSRLRSIRENLFYESELILHCPLKMASFVDIEVTDRVADDGCLVT